MLKKKLFKRILIAGIALSIIGVIAFFVVDSHVKKTARPHIISIEDLPDVDAVIILGAYVFPDGTPSLMLRDRLDTGLEVYNSGKTSRIIVTGDHGQKEYDEVNGMREYLQSRGIERDSIFMDHAGFNTYDSIYRARDIFLVKKAAIVTQEFHLPRALYIARELGLEAYGVIADKHVYPNSSYYNTREMAARFKDFCQLHILHTKPKFLGEAIPVWEDGSKTDDGKT
jgi:SanA protein